ncbi:DUF4263 domain-containing protein, partial [Acidobacteria bacterium AH-259-G07]|nr:DUF4263 domain-containing protein [Acidobacteria bacterium AH-259-G07]
ILDPTSKQNYKSVAEFFLSNKRRAEILSLVRYAIHLNFGIPVSIQGIRKYVSPYHRQWLANGVILMEDDERFEGLMLGYYQDSSIGVLTAKRDKREGEGLGKEDMEFVPIERIQLQNKAEIEPIADMDAGIRELRHLLDRKCKGEAPYQELLEKYPWLLGSVYHRVQAHTYFDDKRIPDFTAIRSKDNCRDVVEIKEPFLKCFRRDGNFTSVFLQAWDQLTEYVDFATQNADYLYREKGLRFDNPRGYLLIGKNFTENERRKFQKIERQTPRLTVLNYGDLLQMAKETAKFVEKLRTSVQDVSEN